MNSRKLIVSGLLLVGLVAGVHAAIPANSDIVLGFTASGGSGAATHIEIDVGSASSFLGLSSGSYSLGNFNASLSGVYGSDWATSSTTSLIWGAIGATGNGGSNISGVADKTIWASSVQNSGGTSTAWTRKQAYAYSTPNSNVTGVYNGFGNGSSLSETGTTTALGTTINAVQTGTSTLGSWSSQGASTLFAMSTFATGVTFQGSVGSNLDLYQNSPIGSGTAPSSLLGYFALSSTGDLSFNVTPVPEPSTYAAILGLAALGFVMIRRRQQGFAS